MGSNHTWLYMHLLVCTVCGIYGRQQSLLFTTANKVKTIDLDTGVVRDLANTSFHVYSIAYDVIGRNVYAAKYFESIIERFSYPNNQTVNFEVVVSTNNPFSVAFDSENGHLYWTEYVSAGKIMRCNSDGSDLTTIANETNPFTLSLDPRNRWIFYSISTSDALYRMTFDGKEKQVFINLAGLAIDINVDFVVKRVYWMGYSTGELKSAWYNGSDVKTVVNESYNSREFDFGGDNVLIYTKQTQILKIHKSSGRFPAVVHTDTTQIFGLLYYTQEVTVQAHQHISRSISVTVLTIGYFKSLLISNVY